MDDTILSLKTQLWEKEREIAALKKKLDQSEKGNSILTELQEKVTNLSPLKSNTTLNNDDIMRYSRQLLLPELGVKGQVAISNLSVLVVGCGGLGCPVAQYLAAAGIGRLGLLDYDVVELSNLHRQVLHTELTQGQPKALSAAQAISRLNSTVQCVPYHLQLSRENAIQLIQQYDIVADCSDNVPTRYLVNDACVLTGKPLVSASALRMEGQLTVYNYRGGPCYRCLYPAPPPPETVTNCSDGGVLGVVPGIIGCLQALEVLKIASGQRSSFEKQLLMFDGQEGRFRSIRLRPKQAECVVCGETPTVTELQDYEQFCGSAATDKCRRLILLTKEQRVSVQEYKAILDSSTPHLLIDVRPKVEVDICHLPTSINIPLSSLENKKAEHITLLKDTISDHKQQMDNKSQVPVFVVCKLGNDSQKAVQLLEKMSGQEIEQIAVKDVIGGLMAWAKRIDPTFPQY
ncbi:adenylyltransferase and sulfurtransferase MOCS3-like [Sinocyclocheilus anshuiensis]|uniref:adenylyltransferase and sulfurtransferase MOCS3-like n=1 Tax=Sinocyclocheilus anshuiensis TaxID=1608454 RepID=UPI0007B7E88F|nr:PREDICTED: adenylyltransferase and sulfurtransferase MOCS3-like [Sinocyclocheilus anshuiensis]